MFEKPEGFGENKKEDDVENGLQKETSEGGDHNNGENPHQTYNTPFQRSRIILHSHTHEGVPH